MAYLQGLLNYERIAMVKPLARKVKRGRKKRMPKNCLQKDKAQVSGSDSSAPETPVKSKTKKAKTAN